MTTDDTALLMAQKFRTAEEKVSAQNGGFYLFGLFERARTPGRWDLIVSAPWLGTDYAGTQKIISLLTSEMNLDDWRMVSAVLPLEPDADYVRWFTQRHHQEHQVEETYNAVFNGVSVSRAFIITANPSPMPALAQPVAA